MDTRVLAAGLVAVSIAGGAALVRAQGASVGDFDTSADVGAPRLPGSATYNAVSQEYRLSAGGVNMWGPRDEFRFAWKRLKGDFILQARVRFLGEGVDPHRKAGVIARTSLDADSPYADAAVHGDGLISLQFRRTKGAPTEEARPEVKGADVVQLERKGSTVTLSAARFGEQFKTSQVESLALGDDVYVGLFVCSHNPDVVESAVFRDVRLVRPAREGFVPYRDYIGSRLEILDVQTGNRQVVHSSAEPFEAPNWTRDGRALIYSTSGRSEGRGRLRRFDLATRRSSPIDTGSAVRNNNDHVLSFDGAWLGISGQTAGDGQSAVYTVPVAGGTPKGSRASRPRTFTAGRRTAGPSSTPAGGTASSTFTGSPRTGRARRRTSLATRGSTTGRSTRRTGGTSTSTRPAAGRCRSGG